MYERAALAIFLAGMVLVPAAGLVSTHRPAEFSWQMFSIATDGWEYEIEHANGQREPVEPDEWVATMRLGHRLADLLPPHLCEELSPAAVVVTSTTLGEEPTSARVPCP